MQISFKDLEKALAPIEEISQGEITFDLGSFPITLRLLTPEEEIGVQKYSSQILEEEGATVPMEYADRMRLSVLSYAIVQVGDQDFRKVDFVETEEKLDNGKVIKEPRHLAMRKFIKRWTSPTILGLFRYYSDLIVQVEQKVEAAFNYTPIDLNTEIVRLEKRIVQLKKEMNNQSKKLVSPVTEKIKIIAEVDKEEMEDREKDIEAYISTTNKVPQEHKSIIPPVASPPPAVEIPPKTEVPADEDDDDSFTDMEDPEKLQKAMDAETRRLIESRKVAGGRPVPNVGGSRRPPHADALETEESLMHQAVEEGSSGNRPVFRLPPQELGVPQQQGALRGLPADQVSEKTTKNPNFRKPASQG